MSTAQTIASQRFLDAMGAMVLDNQKMNAVISFIQSIQDQEPLPTISYKELEQCMPLESAFCCLREKAADYYTTK